MVDNVAASVKSASSRTRVDAFVSDAGFVSAAFGAEHTLRPAGLVRISDELCRTSTNSVVALRVRSTR
jgi:hypothetical protein